MSMKYIGLKTLKIDAFSPLYELESGLQCALDAIEVTESQIVNQHNKGV